MDPNQDVAGRQLAPRRRPRPETDEEIDKCTWSMCDINKKVKAEQKYRDSATKEIGAGGASRNVLLRTDLKKKKVIFK